MLFRSEVKNAMTAPDFKERLSAAGVEPWLGSPEELAALVKSESARYAAIIKRAGLKPE